MIRVLPACLFLLLSCSCAKYAYEVVEPPLQSPQVGTDQDVIFAAGPMSYHFRIVDGRLLVHVYNATSTKIELVGVKSAVTDPRGQSRPIRSQMIPPGAFAEIALPPVRPVFVDEGRPGYVGPGYSSSGSLGRSYIGPGVGRDEFGLGFQEPQVYRLEDGGANYWNWDGEGNARLDLLFNVDGREVSQSFVLGRRRLP